MNVIHTALWVSDLEAARSFFVDALGLSENWSFELDGVQNVYVGGEHGELQLRYDPDREVPAGDRDRLDHVAVSVADTDARTEAVLERADAELLEGPLTMDAPNARVAFIEGPDGYVVELVEDLG